MQQRALKAEKALEEARASISTLSTQVADLSQKLDDGKQHAKIQRKTLFSKETKLRDLQTKVKALEKKAADSEAELEKRRRESIGCGTFLLFKSLLVGSEEFARNSRQQL